jgi:hypothetical protein
MMIGRLLSNAATQHMSAQLFFTIMSIFDQYRDESEEHSSFERSLCRRGPPKLPLARGPEVKKPNGTSD